VVFVQRYKYMHIYLWTALRIVVFERGLCGGDFFIFSHGFVNGDW